jgi:hypothetical protein
MRRSFDKSTPFVKRMALAMGSMRLVVDKKPLLQDKETLHPNNGRGSAIKKRERKRSKTHWSRSKRHLQQSEALHRDTMTLLRDTMMLFRDTMTPFQGKMMLHQGKMRLHQGEMTFLQDSTRFFRCPRARQEGVPSLHLGKPGRRASPDTTSRLLSPLPGPPLHAAGAARTEARPESRSRQSRHANPPPLLSGTGAGW